MIEPLVLISNHCFGFKTMLKLLRSQIFDPLTIDFIGCLNGIVFNICNRDLNRYMRRRLHCGKWLFCMGWANSTTLAHFGINAFPLFRVTSVSFRVRLWVIRPCIDPTQTPVHCMFSPGSCRENLTPMVFRVSFGFIIARENCLRLLP